MKKMPIMKVFYLLLIITSSVVANDESIQQIINVKSWDSLNLRSEPGVKSGVIAKIPANADSISLLGEKVAVGETLWVKINWQGKQGWVSQYFLKPVEIKSSKTLAEQHNKPNKQEEVDKISKQQAEGSSAKPVKQKAVTAPIEKGVAPNQWILRCGNTQPFWRVDVYPKALKVFTGKSTTLLPITYKKQQKNKWNTAKKTHLKGATAKDKIDLEIRYSYERCNDTLSKKKVPYAATIKHNDKEMKGCCRALKIN